MLKIVLVGILWNRLEWNMSKTVVVTTFGHVSMCCCSPHFRTCSAMSFSLALWFLFLPLWYQATSELDILHPVLKFGCSFFAHEFGTNTRLALKFVSRARKFCARLMFKLGSRAALSRARKFCARLMLKFVSRARTSCSCAEAVVAQSLFLCPVCETFLSFLTACTAVFSIS